MASIPELALSGLSRLLAKEMGLRFPRERWGELERGISAASREFGFASAAECIRWLTSAPLSRPQVETLARHLTVGETYFFRDPQTLEVAESEVLPELVRERRGKDQRLRIWSAGCSTGEEPYSIAMLLYRLLPDLADWNITILATDINPASLRKAIAASYGSWSFRGAPSWYKTLYFTAEPEGRLRVIEPIRRLVSFGYLNLAEDIYPSLPTNTNAMDLIFCRNVLMYLEPEMAGEVVGKLYKSLVDGGWLLVGPAESFPKEHAPFQSVNLRGGIWYRKEPPPAARPGEPLPPATMSPQPVSSTAPLEEPGPREAALPAPGGRWEEAAELYLQGDYLRACALIRENYQAEEMPHPALSLLIRCHANRGELDRALALCEEALQRDRLDAAMQYLHAEILQEQGRREDALLSLQRTIYLDPNHILAHFALGNLSRWSGREDRAQRHFRNALSLLEGRDPEGVLPGSEGITAARLRAIILPMTNREPRREGGRR
jgi:chemotaxis protein methyltransferase CheR